MPSGRALDAAEALAQIERVRLLQCATRPWPGPLTCHAFLAAVLDMHPNRNTVTVVVDMPGGRTAVPPVGIAPVPEPVRREATRVDRVSAPGPGQTLTSPLGDGSGPRGSWIRHYE